MATYIENENEQYQGNPLIAALPIELGGEDIIASLCHYPIYNQSDRKMDKEKKILRIKQLYHFYQPFNIHVEIYKDINFMIKEAYLPRNPIKNLKDFNEKVYANYQGVKNNEVRLITNRNMGIGKALVGAAGIGKTSAINKILDMIPTVIIHNEYKKQDFRCTQIPYLSILAPYDSSLKALLLNILSEVDIIANTDYYNRAIGTRATINMLISQVQQIVTVYHIGLIVIDEFQFLNRKPEQVVNFLTSVMNMWGVSLFLVGTPPVLDVLQKDLRVARRFSLLSYKKMEKDEKEWNYLLADLWQYQYTTQVAQLTEEIADCFYHYSQGITDVFIKLFIEVQIEAVEKNRKITVSLIRTVAKDKMMMVEPMIEAMQGGDKYQLLKYQDI
ncbi:MAG TPA: AAA family ATPase [Epulopiscium sp.]|nr:AAA family ATPase [Candidatus Epulonipiscium sp.]